MTTIDRIDKASEQLINIECYDADPTKWAKEVEKIIGNLFMIIANQQDEIEALKRPYKKIKTEQ